MSTIATSLFLVPSYYSIHQKPRKQSLLQHFTGRNKKTNQMKGSEQRTKIALESTSGRCRVKLIVGIVDHRSVSTVDYRLSSLMLRTNLLAMIVDNSCDQYLTTRLVDCS